MWKESYRIGVTSIDQQHIQLFKMVHLLLQAIKDGSNKDTFFDTIDFLKKYVVFHFDEEEAYQRSIHYSGFEQHRKHHQEFTATILGYEKRLIENSYDIPTLKDLAGTLTAWLIYHVSGEDQEIVAGDTAAAPKNNISCINSFCFYTLDVLQKITGAVFGDIKQSEQHTPEQETSDGDIFVKIDLIEGVLGTVIFEFPQEFAFELMRIMTFTTPERVDEFVCSALAEVSNIICGNAVTGISGGEIRCSITTPAVSMKPYAVDPEFEAATLVTPVGALRIATKLV